MIESEGDDRTKTVQPSPSSAATSRQLALKSALPFNNFIKNRPFSAAC